MKLLISLAAALTLMACNSVNTHGQMNILPDTLQLGHSILSRDTVTTATYPLLTAAQCHELAEQTGFDVPDSSRLIGMRPINDEVTIAAYLIPTGEDPNMFKVYLVAHVGNMAQVSKGHLSRGIHVWWYHDLGYFHTSEYQGRPRLGGNRFYTTDAELRFDDADHFTLHRVMTLTSLFLKDHSTHEMWRVEWDNRYGINDEGVFYFIDQQETYRSAPDLDDPMIDVYKSRDRLDDE